jgi:hypothetical protein
MVEKKKELSTTSVYKDDLSRIQNLRRGVSRRKGLHKPYRENSANVISRALDALEKEQDSQ